MQLAAVINKASLRNEWEYPLTSVPLVTGSESEGDNDGISNIVDEHLDGPAPLESDEHFHLFIYHSQASEDQDQVDHYTQMLETRWVTDRGKYEGECREVSKNNRSLS